MRNHTTASLKGSYPSQNLLNIQLCKPFYLFSDKFQRLSSTVDAVVEEFESGTTKNTVFSVGRAYVRTYVRGKINWSPNFCSTTPTNLQYPNQTWMMDDG